MRVKSICSQQIGERKSNCVLLCWVTCARHGKQIELCSHFPCFTLFSCKNLMPHFQVKPSPTLRFNAEISTTLYYSVITITSTTIINLLQPPLHWSVIESLFEINYLLLSGREGVTIFCTQSIDFCRRLFFCNRKQIYKRFKPHFHVNLSKPVFAQHVKDKNKHPCTWCSAPCQNNPFKVAEHSFGSF